MNDGDFIKIDFEMRTGEDRKLVATNLKDLAMENNIYDESKTYKDAVLIVGTENLFKEINESFKNTEIGKETEVEIKAEDAYGLRDPNNIRVHTVRELQKLEIDPVVGKEVTINKKRGRIISVTPGRVLVDYNHQYAGKPVFYKYTIKSVIEDPVEKARSIIEMNYTQSADKFDLSIENDLFTVKLPEEAKFDPFWIEAKFNIVSEVRKYLPDLDINIVETYSKPEKKEEPPSEEPGKTEEEKKEEEIKEDQK
ncbi:MAG: FKBP-type peptidyl-prolyl cis-trans isomerase [Thermoplasmataceae archaeon]